MAADTAVLARTSVEEKRKMQRGITGHSNDVQVAWGLRVCQERRWSAIRPPYVQDGGHSDDIYPRLYDLLKDVEKGKVRRVVCEYHDRLGRGEVLYRVVGWLHDYDVYFHSSDLSDDVGRDGFDQLLGSYSGMGSGFLRRVRERTKEALDMVKKEGKKARGRHIAGFDFKDGHWIPSPPAEHPSRIAARNLRVYKDGGEDALLAAIEVRAKGSAARRTKAKRGQLLDQRRLFVWLEEHRPLKQDRVSL